MSKLALVITAFVAQIIVATGVNAEGAFVVSNSGIALIEGNTLSGEWIVGDGSGTLVFQDRKPSSCCNKTNKTCC